MGRGFLPSRPETGIVRERDGAMGVKAGSFVINLGGLFSNGREFWEALPFAEGVFGIRTTLFLGRLLEIARESSFLLFCLLHSIYL